jgi:hypothetical protein
VVKHKKIETKETVTLIEISIHTAIPGKIVGVAAHKRTHKDQQLSCLL